MSDPAREFVMTYIKYMKNISGGQIGQIDFLDTAIQNQVDMYNNNDSINKAMSLGSWFRLKAQEYNRLNEYYDRFGVIQPPEASQRRPGGRYLP